MQYNWFKIFNLIDFQGLNLVSKEYVLVLEALGEKTFLVTRGNLISITYDGVQLSLSLNDKNPFEFEDHAIYKDENDDVFIGLPIGE